MEVEIRQRTKKSPITANAVFRLRKNSGKHEDSISKAMPKTVTFAMTADPEDWRTLYRMALGSPEDLGRMILLLGARVHQEKIQRMDYPPVRGFHVVSRGKSGEDNWDEERYFNHTRAYAAAASAVLTYWLKKSPDARPDFLKKIIAEMKKSLGTKLGKRTGKLKPLPAIKYLVESKFGKIRRKFGFKDLNYDSFKNRYLIGETNPYLSAAKDFFEKRNHEMSVEELFSVII